MAATLFRAVGVAVLLLLLQFVTVVLCSFPATLTLERSFPTNHKVELSQLRARDRLRHGRVLSGVVDFPVGGTFNPYLVGYSFLNFLLKLFSFFCFLFCDCFSCKCRTRILVRNS